MAAKGTYRSRASWRVATLLCTTLRVACFGASLFAVSAYAGTISVTSPALGTAAIPTFVGASTSIAFTLTGMANQAQVSATVKRVADNTILTTIPQVNVNPDPTNHNGSGTLVLALSPNTPVETYRVEVRAVDVNASTTYNSDQNLFIKPALSGPKILQFSPISGSFVKGIIPIVVKASAPNLQSWRVQVNGQDIPGGSGNALDSSSLFRVNWDTSTVLNDGVQTITISVKDLAGNEATQTLSLTVDRVPPIVTIQGPINGFVIAPGTTIGVTVDVRDQSDNSVFPWNVDVIVRSTTGTFITRVPRASFTSVNSTTSRWYGRVRWVTGVLPPQFIISAAAIDRAGNLSSLQKVTVSIGS